MRWGLVPFWAKDIKLGYKFINTRSETASEKLAFRSTFGVRRCVIPASGFFEWKREDKAKHPYYITRKGDAPMSFAGLWERWDNKGEAGWSAVLHHPHMRSQRLNGAHP